MKHLHNKIWIIYNKKLTMKYYFIEIIESLIIKFNNKISNNKVQKCLTNKTRRIKFLSNRIFFK